MFKTKIKAKLKKLNTVEEFFTNFKNTLKECKCEFDGEISETELIGTISCNDEKILNRTKQAVECLKTGKYTQAFQSPMGFKQNQYKGIVYFNELAFEAINKT